MIYEYYDPHPHVCHMKQYEGCKNHKSCPLYHLCKEMKSYAETSKVCKRDCATCNFSGCSMPFDKRKTEPFYIGGWLREQPIPSLPIDIALENERTIHNKTHQQLYHYYNMLWNEEYRQRLRSRQQQYKKERREQINLREKQRYRKKREGQPKQIKKNPMFMPPCQYDCLNCSKPDCDVPANYYQQQVSKHYYEQHKEQVLRRTKKYQQDNPEKQKSYLRKSYYKHQEQRLQYAKDYRKTNKKEVAEYNKKYRQSHKDAINLRRRQNYARKKAEREAQAQSAHP